MIRGFSTARFRPDVHGLLCEHVGRLKIRQFRLAHPGLAGVVDRDRELHFHLRQSLGFNVATAFNFTLKFGSRNDLQIADNAGLVGQTKRLGLRFQAKFGNTHIHPIS